MTNENTPLLELRDVTIQYRTDDGVAKAVNHVSFQLNRGETLGLVGETGAGKTTTALGIMGLLPYHRPELPAAKFFTMAKTC